MSLPREVQEKVIKSIPGMEKARIAQYGYAVEYASSDLSMGLEELNAYDI